jgi:hypothetical protein
MNSLRLTCCSIRTLWLHSCVTLPWYMETQNFAHCFCTLCGRFGIKCVDINHAHHLLNTLQKYYKISTDWAGADYCGLRLQWNYKQQYVDVSMPNYIKKTLQKFQHPQPAKAQHHDWI